VSFSCESIEARLRFVSSFRNTLWPFFGSSVDITACLYSFRVPEYVTSLEIAPDLHFFRLDDDG